MVKYQKIGGRLIVNQRRVKTRFSLQPGKRSEVTFHDQKILFKQQVYGKYGNLCTKPPQDDGLIIKMSFQNIFEKLKLTPVKL